MADESSPAATMTSIKDIAKRRFRGSIVLALFLTMTCLVLAQPTKNLDQEPKLRSVSCQFFLSPDNAKIWRRTDEGQRNFLGTAGQEIHFGLNDAEAEGRREIIVEFSVPLWTREWESEKAFLSTKELAKHPRFPESGTYSLRLTRSEYFQALTKAHPKLSFGILALFCTGLVTMAKVRSKRQQKSSASLYCGEYELGELLGRGGMGEVYAAVDRDGSSCAVKKIRPELTERKGFRELFNREISTCLKLQHPNLVPIYAFGVTEFGEVYLVSKKLEGETLKERLSRGDYNPPRLAADVLDQIGGVLSYLHSQNHLHCDVKPSNIFIDEANKLWLMDLGVALSLTGTPVEKAWGSPAYLAPEQEAGQPTFASDQYSLGVVLFEILTGQRPFTETDRASLNYHHKNTPPPSPRELEPRLTEELDATILRMLAKREEERHPNIKSIRDSQREPLLHLTFESTSKS